jgi:hypothetical protein
MTNFNPTKNRTPTGLLTLDEKSALMSWPHGFEFYNEVERVWEPIIPTWGENFIYRGKPAPVVKKRFLNVYPNGTGLSYGSKQEALDAALLTPAIGMIYIEIVDGKIKGVGVAEGDET